VLSMVGTIGWLRSTEEVIRTSEVGVGFGLTIVIPRTLIVSESLADPKLLLQVSA